MKKKIICGIAVLLTLFFVVLVPTGVYASGNDIFVSSSGSDATGDGSKTNPYATLDKACSESSGGDSVVLLSDISLGATIGVKHSLTIKSEDGSNPPFKISRTAYTGAMFNVTDQNGNSTDLVFENITLDGKSASATGNANGMITIQGSAGSTATLGKDAGLMDYGNSPAVFINGGKSKFVMDTGSRITNSGKSSTALAAVYNNYGTFEMKAGSVIDKASGRGGSALLSDYGNNLVDGTISNCVGSGNDHRTLNFRGGNSEIGINAKIIGNTTTNGAVYTMAGAVVTVRGEISGNKINSTSSNASAIYAVDNGAPSKVYIEDGAYIHDNEGTITVTRYGLSINVTHPFAAAVLANNTSSIVMNGGKITNNKTPYAVMVRKNGSFTMNGGEITGNNRGVDVFNMTNNPYSSYGFTPPLDDLGSAKIQINGGSVSGNALDLIVHDSTKGFTRENYLYLGSDIIKTSPEVAFGQEVLKNVLDILTTKTFETEKTITPDPSMKELYLGNAGDAGKTALGNVPEIKAGTLITTWYGASIDDRFSLDIGGLDNKDSDIYVCIMPQNDNGEIIPGQHKIYLCDKVSSGSKMTVSMNVKGRSNAPGYVFGLFTLASPPKNDYTLHYETNGAGNIPDRTALAFDAVDLAPKDELTMKGHDFKGWYMDSDFTREYLSQNSYADIVENEITAFEATLYARWEKKEYTLTFDLNGGNYGGNSENVVRKYKFEEKIKIPDAPEKKGYKFLYWKGSAYRPGQEYTVTEDHRFVAQWAVVPAKESTGPARSDDVSEKNRKHSNTGDDTILMAFAIIMLLCIVTAVTLALRKKRV